MPKIETTQLEQTAEAASSPSQYQLVVFSLGGEEYALPISCIQEVTRYTRPRSIMSTDPWVTGVVDLRGKIVPICDLAARLGLSSEPTDGRKIVIIDIDGATAGVIVDAVDQVIMIQSSQLEHPVTADSDMINAIAKLDDRLVVVLNARALVSVAVSADLEPDEAVQAAA